MLVLNSGVFNNTSPQLVTHIVVLIGLIMYLSQYNGGTVVVFFIFSSTVSFGQNFSVFLFLKERLLEALEEKRIE